jgi:hypothetical protein
MGCLIELSILIPANYSLMETVRFFSNSISCITFASLSDKLAMASVFIESFSNSFWISFSFSKSFPLMV